MNKNSISTGINKQNQKRHGNKSKAWHGAVSFEAQHLLNPLFRKYQVNREVKGAVSAQRSNKTVTPLVSLTAAQEGLWIYCMCKFLQEAIQVQQEWSPRQSVYDATPWGDCVCVCVSDRESNFSFGMCKSVCLFVSKLFIKMLFVQARCSGELVLIGHIHLDSQLRRPASSHAEYCSLCSTVVGLSKRVTPDPKCFRFSRQNKPSSLSGTNWRNSITRN